MLPDLSARANGKTTRVLLRTALAMSQGQRVVIVTPTAQQARSLMRSLATLLEQLGGDPHCMQSHMDVRCWAGYARVVPAGSLEYALKGHTFNMALSDGGLLEDEEQRELYQHVPDVHHFQTEYDDTPPQPVKEERALSSRRR